MARALRIELAGGVFHIYSRGDRREVIFNDDDDRRYWLGLLGKVCRQHHWICYTYCLMDNHYHLLIETTQTTLSSGMHQLNGVYTRAFNFRHGFVGHLFQGRFNSILVEKESYLLELARYVLLNPVRAGKVKLPWKWKWSSGRFLVGISTTPSWTDSKWLLDHFHKNTAQAQEFITAFLLDGIGRSSVWKHLKEGLVLGSSSYADEIFERFGLRRESERDYRNRRKIQVKSLEDYEVSTRNERNASIIEVYTSGAYTMAEIAAHFGISQATVSRVVRAGGSK